MYIEFCNSKKKFRIETADTFAARLLGLMGRENLPNGDGLLLENCGCIHCFFMKFPIDVIYLDGDRKVMYIETVKPWKAGTFKYLFSHKKISVLEVNAGEAKGVQIGEEMRLLI